MEWNIDEGGWYTDELFDLIDEPQSLAAAFPLPNLSPPFDLCGGPPVVVAASHEHSFIDETHSSNFVLPNFELSGGGGGGGDVAASLEIESTRKRGRSSSSVVSGAKACREKQRRERLNERFVDLSNVLEPGRPPKTDKQAIIEDAIRVLTHIRDEAQELKQTNQKLLEEIKSLKAEKNELREEKLVLKADKERLDQQLKGMAISPSGFVPTHPQFPAAYRTGAGKMAGYPGYNMFPMCYYLHPSVLDTSRDHEDRPPAA